jgi:LysR family glycine cleavage system transcriptional activator
MGRSAVVRDDIEQGRLVEPFDVRLSSSLGYHLVMAPQSANLPKVQQFCDWAWDRFSGLRLADPLGGS